MPWIYQLSTGISADLKAFVACSTSSSHSGAMESGCHSPSDALQVRAHHVAELARMVMRDVVREMRTVPDHDVGAID